MPKIQLLLLLNFFVVCCSAVYNSSLIPRSVLFGNPDYSSPKISPDGTMLAYLAPYQGVLNIWLQQRESSDKQVVTHDVGRGIRSYWWGWDNRTLFYLQDYEGDENWNLYKVDIKSRHVTLLTPLPNAQVKLLHYTQQVPTQMLLEINKDDARSFDIYHLNTVTGDLRLQEKNSGDVIAWYADDTLCVRGMLKRLSDGGTAVYLRTTPTSTWQEIKQWNFEEAILSRPLGLNGAETGCYCLDNSNSDMASIVHIDATMRILASHQNYDMEDLICHPHTHKPIAALCIQERKRYTVLDSRYQQDFAALALLDDGDLSLISFDASGNLWTVAFEKDNAPISYYLYDRTKRRAEFLGLNRSTWHKYQFAHKEPITFTARDGLVLHGYVTRATYHIPGKKSPLVVLVHGGPLARDVWGYDPEVQWLANRGITCLQINFRGSTGYGKAFVQAAIKERGRKMQYDLLDGVAWAIEQGIADPQRVAIYGASYGGYAALAGAAFSPEAFCCALDAFGVSNLITFLQTIPAYWANSYAPYYKKYLGDVETDQQFLWERSPLSQVDAIKIPLLIAHGAHDARIKQAESEQIVAALKIQGIACTYLLFPDEGHGFERPENEMTFYAVAERFLAEYLGSRCE